MACTVCETIAQSPLPSQPIESGSDGPGLLAHVLVSKYADHLPLYRQSQIYAREGVDLDRSTMADWVGRSTALFEPLAERIGHLVRDGQTLFADGTPVKMQAPGLKRTKTARVWTYVADRSAKEVRPPAKERTNLTCLCSIGKSPLKEIWLSPTICYLVMIKENVQQDESCKGNCRKE